MKRFEFRLQTPYDVTIWREKLIKQEVKARQTVYDHERQSLDDKLDGMNYLNNQERGLKGKSVSVERVMILKELQEMSKVGIKLQQEVVDQAFFHLEESRQELNDTRKEKKSMEKLRERRYKEFLGDCLRQEQAVIDEAAGIGFWRAKGSYPIKESTPRN